MRIAAGVILLICSTYLVYFFIDHENSSDLAINKTEDTMPAQEEAPAISDSITTSEPKEEKTEKINSKNQALQKENLQEQSAPLAKKDKSEVAIEKESAAA